MPFEDRAGRHAGRTHKGKAAKSKNPRTFEHRLAGGHHRKEGCCFAVQAVKAVWAGKFRLARRYARLDVKTRLNLV